MKRARLDPWASSVQAFECREDGCPTLYIASLCTRMPYSTGVRGGAVLASLISNVPGLKTPL